MIFIVCFLSDISFLVFLPVQVFRIDAIEARLLLDPFLHFL